MTKREAQDLYDAIDNVIHEKMIYYMTPKITPDRLIKARDRLTAILERLETL